jgi:sulfite exporter TauE/SafE
MIDPAIFFTLFTLGLVSGSHCIGMCGGIMGALTMAIPAEAKAKRWMILVAYNGGRISSYTIMGLVAGFFAEQFSAVGGAIILRVLAGILLITMGLYLADWWRGLTKLETLGRYLWVYIQPLGKRLMPVNSIPKALMLGALWGWLPCGLVYAALATAITQPAPGLAAGAMIAFGLGTLPAVLAAGIAAQQLARVLQQRRVRVGLAIIIIVFGVWTIWGSVAYSHGHQHHHSLQDPKVNQIDHASMHQLSPELFIAAPPTANHSTMSQMNHSDHSPATTLERQRTDTGAKMEDYRSSTSSSVEGSLSGDHHQNSNP